MQPHREGKYEYFDHAADVGIRIQAASLPELFILAGRALMEWIGPPPGSGDTITAAVSVAAESTPDLLVRWMQELLYRFHRDHAYFMGAERLDIGHEGLVARVASLAWLESAAVDYQEVKAVTYHQLTVEQEDGGWRASVILDI